MEKLSRITILLVQLQYNILDLKAVLSGMTQAQANRSKSRFTKGICLEIAKIKSGLHPTLCPKIEACSPKTEQLMCCLSAYIGKYVSAMRQKTSCAGYMRELEKIHNQFRKEELRIFFREVFEAFNLEALRK